MKRQHRILIVRIELRRLRRLRCLIKTSLLYENFCVCVVSVNEILRRSDVSMT